MELYTFSWELMKFNNKKSTEYIEIKVLRLIDWVWNYINESKFD